MQKSHRIRTARKAALGRGERVTDALGCGERDLARVGGYDAAFVSPRLNAGPARACAVCSRR